jgi:hypothetical protein
MLKADKATVSWDAGKKHWHVRLPKTAQDTSEDALRSKAIEAAKDDGYEVDPSKVAIVR